MSEPPATYLDAFARAVDQLTPDDMPADAWRPALEAMADARAVAEAREERRREVFERHYRAWHAIVTQALLLGGCAPTMTP